MGETKFHTVKELGKGYKNKPPRYYASLGQLSFLTPEILSSLGESKKAFGVMSGEAEFTPYVPEKPIRESQKTYSLRKSLKSNAKRVNRK